MDKTKKEVVETKVKLRNFYFPELGKSIKAENSEEATKIARNLSVKKEKNVGTNKKDTILKK